MVQFSRLYSDGKIASVASALDGSAVGSTFEAILYEPAVTKAEWIALWSKDNDRRQVARPCWVWPSRDDPKYVLSQPSSSFFVMLVAFSTIYAGVRYYLSWRSSKGGEYEFSRLFWAMGLICWGLGAFLAGLSYEALEWHLKCELHDDNDRCVLYSWLELVYVMFQVAACDFSLLGSLFVSRFVKVRWFWRIFWLGMFDYLFYSFFVAIGGILGVQKYMSFEFCLVFCGLSMIVGVGVSLVLPLYHFLSEKKQGQKITEFLPPRDMAMLRSWGIMTLSGVVYFLYYSIPFMSYPNFESFLWDQYGIWITANDFLHILLTWWAISMLNNLPLIEDSDDLRNRLASYISVRAKKD